MPRRSLSAPTLILLVLLTACGRGSAEPPTPPANPSAATEAPPQPPAASSEPTEPPIEPTDDSPAPTPVATLQVIAPPSPPTTPQPGSPPIPQNEPLDAIRETLLVRAQEPDRVSATLYQHLTSTVYNGESVVFHWEDSYAGVVVGCSGHAVTLLGGDGFYKVQTVSAYCGPTQVSQPITVFPSQGVDPAGQPVMVVFGEVYSAQVASIRVAYSGGEVPALIVGGGWYAELPFGAIGVTARAYDASGSILYQDGPAS